MRLRLQGQTLLEKLAVALGWAPTPLVESLHAMLMCRTLMAACKLGIFSALEQSSLTPEQLAGKIGVHPHGVRRLLNSLVALGYLRLRGDHFGMTSSARRWLLPKSKNSLHDNLVFRYLEWEILENLEQMVVTGEPIDAHEMITGDSWPIYQRGLRAIARQAAGEIAQRLRLPVNARNLLDVGGAHGEYTASLCARYSGLRAVVLELPSAVESAEQVFLESHALLSDRVAYVGGDAMTYEFGEHTLDLAFISQLIHHFSADDNRQLFQRLTTALRPGGILAVVEPLRPDRPGRNNQLGQLLDMYFALTSRSGTWSLEEIQDWQRTAGVMPDQVIHLRTLPGVAVVVGRKQERI